MTPDLQLPAAFGQRNAQTVARFVRKNPHVHNIEAMERNTFCIAYFDYQLPTSTLDALVVRGMSTVDVKRRRERAHLDSGKRKH